MTDFTPTVTITLKEYDQLRRDAAPVQCREELSRVMLMDAYNEFIRACDRFGAPAAKEAERRLGLYLRYIQRCALNATAPVAFGDWEVWTKAVP